MSGTKEGDRQNILSSRTHGRDEKDSIERKEPMLCTFDWLFTKVAELLKVDAVVLQCPQTEGCGFWIQLKRDYGVCRFDGMKTMYAGAKMVINDHNDERYGEQRARRHRPNSLGKKMDDAGVDARKYPSEREPEDAGSAADGKAPDQFGRGLY